MRVGYLDSRLAWAEFGRIVEDLILKTGAHVIGDLGGGANPLLSLEFIQANNLDYRIIDLQVEELNKCDDGYTKIQGDLASKEFQTKADFDLVFSNMLVEHIENPVQFHKNVAQMLKINGLAFHYFPTITSLPMFVNKILNEKFGQLILDKMLPGVRQREGNLRKFPAFYRWCLGPLKIQERRFKKLGFNVVEYRGCFGYQGYFTNFPKLLRLHQYITDFLVKNSVAWLTDGAQVLLVKGEPSTLTITTKFIDSQTFKGKL
jgi:SAM-dependent methyltransferase